MFKKLFIFPVKVYKLVISPLLPNACRFYPSCSQYTIEAIQEWGVLKGISLGAKRLSKCHPWGSSGHDPVPKKSNGEKKVCKH